MKQYVHLCSSFEWKKTPGKTHKNEIAFQWKRNVLFTLCARHAMRTFYGFGNKTECLRRGIIWSHQRETTTRLTIKCKLNVRFTTKLYVLLLRHICSATNSLLFFLEICVSVICCDTRPFPRNLKHGKRWLKRAIHESAFIPPVFLFLSASTVRCYHWDWVCHFYLHQLKMHNYSDELIYLTLTSRALFSTFCGRGERESERDARGWNEWKSLIIKYQTRYRCWHINCSSRTVPFHIGVYLKKRLRLAYNLIFR